MSDGPEDLVACSPPVFSGLFRFSDALSEPAEGAVVDSADLEACSLCCSLFQLLDRFESSMGAILLLPTQHSGVTGFVQEKHMQRCV